VLSPLDSSSHKTIHHRAPPTASANWTTPSAGEAVRFSLDVFAHSSHQGGYTNARCARIAAGRVSLMTLGPGGTRLRSIN
jgi:hypothetical protein